MLSLTRKPGQSVVIRCPDGSVIEIVVILFQRNQVRLGIGAPKEFIINRHEVDEIMQEKKEAEK